MSCDVHARPNPFYSIIDTCILHTSMPYYAYSPTLQISNIPNMAHANFQRLLQKMSGDNRDNQYTQKTSAQCDCLPLASYAYYMQDKLPHMRSLCSCKPPNSKVNLHVYTSTFCNLCSTSHSLSLSRGEKCYPNIIGNILNFLNNLSMHTIVFTSSTQFLQWSKDCLKGQQMSTIGLERHRSGFTALICAIQAKSYLFTACTRRNTDLSVRLNPTSTFSCERDHLEVIRSTSPHLSHSNLEFFDYSVVKVQNKNPDLCSSILVILPSTWQTRLSACRNAASHAVLECLNKNQDLFAKFMLKCNRL
jgi:hypothetical protein